MNDIENIKQKHGNSAERIISSGLGLVSKGKKYHCPNVYAHKNKDKNPSMSWDPNALQYHCFTCGMNIDIYGYYRDHLNYTHQEVLRELLGETDYRNTSMQKNRDSFSSELKNISDITNECVSYIKLRGITEETIKAFSIRSYKGMIAFPYYKFETLVGYKIRKPLKNPGNPKMMSVTGSKPYLFNAQNIVDCEELIICEGEFDAMVIHQCGYSNVVSVGAGANSMAALVEQGKDFILKHSSIIIVSDNDEAGSSMDKFFVDTFGDKAKLIDKKLYDRKDINEEYAVNGKEKIIDIIESARFKIEGRRDLEKTPYKGLKKEKGRYIPTGMPDIDYTINDLAPGCTTLLTGRSNGGKTTFVKQVIANAIDKGNKVYLMNGENDPETLINEIYQLVIGRDENNYTKVKINKRYRKEPKQDVLEKIKKWHHKKLYMFNKGESNLKSIKELTSMLEVEIKFNQYDLVVIDNLMSILSVSATEKNEQQADFMQKLTEIAKLYNTHIILVLHPNKTYVKGTGMDFEQISGTSDLYNKADNIISVIRYYDEEKTVQGLSGKVEVLKNRYYPELIEVETHYDAETGLLLQVDKNTGDYMAYSFNFNNKGPINGFKEVQTSLDIF